MSLAESLTDEVEDTPAEASANNGNGHLSVEERNAIVLRLSGLIWVKALRRYRSEGKRIIGLEPGDLVQAANLRILDQAADNFRPDNGTKFETFVNPHIDGAIKDELRDRNSLSRGDQEKAKAWSTAEYELAQQLQRTPSFAEVTAALGVDLKEADRMRLLAGEVREVRIDQISSSAGGEIWDAPSDFRELISDPRYDRASLDDHVIFVEKVELVEETISRLKKPEQERQILLGATACRPLDEIAKEYGVTASRISQRVNSTRREIRKELDEYDAAA